MLISIFVLGMVFILIDYFKYHWDSGFAILGGLMDFISIIFIIAMAINIVDLMPIDAKIEMHEEENQRIEQQIAEAIDNYQSHEKEVFAATAPDSAITLISLYPELKSDQLIQSQIDTYVKNNSRIRELKNKKLNSGVYRWWLYFGK